MPAAEIWADMASVMVDSVRRIRSAMESSTVARSVHDRNRGA